MTDPSPTADRSLGAPRRLPDWAVVVAMTVIAGLLVVGLYLVSRDKDSAQSNSPGALPIPNVSADTGCTNFGNYWLKESGVKLGAADIEGITNCRLAADGTWFVPTGPDDERLPAEFALTDEERVATESIRAELIAQIEDLESHITNSVQRDLDAIFDPRVQPVMGYVKEGVGITRARSRYTRVAQSFLMAPENATLATYVGWKMETRIRAYERLRDSCVNDPAVEYLLTVCRGLEDSLSVWFPPWTWDLRDPVSMDAYLAYLVRSQQLPDGS